MTPLFLGTQLLLRGPSFPNLWLLSELLREDLELWHVEDGFAVLEGSWITIGNRETDFTTAAAQTFEEILDAVAALPAAGRKIWGSASRTFDVGMESAVADAPLETFISPRLLEQLGREGVQLQLTLHPLPRCSKKTR
jgi:hypothetical protein